MTTTPTSTPTATTLEARFIRSVNRHWWLWLGLLLAVASAVNHVGMGGSLGGAVAICVETLFLYAVIAGPIAFVVGFVRGWRRPTTTPDKPADA